MREHAGTPIVSWRAQVRRSADLRGSGPVRAAPRRR